MAGDPQFPDRDVIIIHTDMRPLPSDCGTDWYDQLLAHVDRLPAAAIVACDLLYPVQTPSGGYYAQCAGGTLSDGAIDFIGGGVDTPSGAVDPSRAVVYGPQFRNVRRAQWVTFGGIYIRRELLDMVGNFDPQYEWAYVMDVDYCLEALVRGQDCYQVPVNLLHEENGTTRSFLAQAEYHQKVLANVERFKTKWAWLLSSM